MKFKNEKLQYEYEKLFAYDIELTKLRWTVFAALFSVSLLIPGFALKDTTGIQSLEPWAKYAVAFGFLVYLAAYYHYWWFHRISHLIRKRLEEIEKSEDIKIIRIRIRPEIDLSKICKGLKINPIKIYFHWMIWILGLAYAFLTYQIVGCPLFFFFIGVLIGVIIIIVVISKLWEIIKAKIKAKRNTPTS